MQTKNKQSNKKGSKYSSSGNKNKVEQIANQLDDLARRKLRDGRLDGNLCGYEADIRQESILLALEWYVRSYPQDARNDGGTEWNAPKQLAIAMKYARLRLIEKLNKQPRGDRPASEADFGVIKHPSDEHEHEWPEHRARVVICEGISQALKGGLISPRNALVARMVICKGEEAIVVAKQLGVHRSAIYQHISKVKNVIAPLVKDIEVSLHD